LVPAGINLIDGRRIDEAELEEEILVIDREEVAMNVNTPQDLEIVERLVRARMRKHDQENVYYFYSSLINMRFVESQ